jgi:hypothetical protein
VVVARMKTKRLTFAVCHPPCHPSYLQRPPLQRSYLPSSLPSTLRMSLLLLSYLPRSLPSTLRKSPLLLSCPLPTRRVLFCPLPCPLTPLRNLLEPSVWMRLFFVTTTKPRSHIARARPQKVGLFAPGVVTSTMAPYDYDCDYYPLQYI